MVEQQRFRDAMARLGAAVNVVPTDGPAGRGGFTASAVCSVTDDPPTLLVCMNRGSSLNETFKTNGVLCVNTLAASQEALSPLFAGFTEVERGEWWAAADWTALETGAPVLLRDVERGAGIQLVFLVVLLGAAWANFMTRDISS